MCSEILNETVEASADVLQLANPPEHSTLPLAIAGSYANHKGVMVSFAFVLH